jgi:hypothetical protein
VALRYEKTFPNYEAASQWLKDRGLSAAVKTKDVEHFVDETVKIWLEGEAAKSVLDTEYPIAPTGFRLREVAP